MVTDLCIKETSVGKIKYFIVEHNKSKYLVGYITNEKRMFVCDEDDSTKVVEYEWKTFMDNYIGSVNGDNSILYLHNLVMGKLTYEGKGQPNTVDHINRCGYDNRKCNLRMCTQTEQNHNQKRRERHGDLPEDIESQMIPRCVWYAKPNGGHGGAFILQIKGVEGIPKEDTYFRSSRSNKLANTVKLQQVIDKIKELKEKYPNKLNHIALENEDNDTTTTHVDLVNSYNAIISQMNGYTRDHVIENNKIASTITATTSNVLTNIEEQETLKIVQTFYGHDGRKKANLITLNDGDTYGPEILGKMSYYQAKKSNRGDCFVIEKRHPVVTNGLYNNHKMCTTASTKVNTLHKYFEYYILMENFNKLLQENGHEMIKMNDVVIKKYSEQYVKFKEGYNNAFYCDTSKSRRHKVDLTINNVMDEDAEIIAE